jgi:precorrin-2/cobalt-factor-2 C20-methyltransferase
MRKTSVYLPDGLKARLADMARRSGRSEAQLVRLAVERLVASELVAAGPAATGVRDDPVVSRNRTTPGLVGVGMGPGDPGLVTARAVAALRAADRVLAPTTSAAAVGRAEAIVREAVPDVPVERVVFVMETDGAARSAALAAVADRVVDLLDVGERVAFVTLGDPNVYSTFASVADEVRRRRPSVPVESIPGIMAFQDLAARSGTVLVDGDERLVLVPAHRGDGAAAVALAAADERAAVVVYKGGGRLPELAATLAAAGRLDGAVLGELLGLPGGRVARVADVADRPATYLATLVVPPVR